MNKFIPFYEPLIKPEYAEAVKQQILSGWIGWGDITKRLEKILSEFWFNEKSVLTVTSGTTALLLAAQYLIDKNIINDKKKYVILPDYIMPAAAQVCSYLKFDIIIAPVNKHLLLDDVELEKIIRKIGSENIAAVFYINHNGRFDNLLDIKTLCKNNDIFLIEDAACSFGKVYKRGDLIYNAGTIGDISTISFSVPKTITSGQGGCIIFDEDDRDYFIKQIDQGGLNWRITGVHTDIGLNFKFNDILASYILAQLNNIDEILKIKKNIHNWYIKYLTENNLIHHFETEENSQIPWYNMLIFKSNFIVTDCIINKMNEYNIRCKSPYIQLTQQPFMKKYKNITNSNCNIHKNVLYLPSGLALSEKDVKFICESLKTVMKELKYE